MAPSPAHIRTFTGWRSQRPSVRSWEIHRDSAELETAARLGEGEQRWVMCEPSSPSKKAVDNAESCQTRKHCEGFLEPAKHNKRHLPRVVFVPVSVGELSSIPEAFDSCIFRDVHHSLIIAHLSSVSGSKYKSSCCVIFGKVCSAAAFSLHFLFQ